MMRYNEWKLLTESMMPLNLGLKQNPTIGGLVGSQFQEVGFGEKSFKDEDLEDLEDDEDDLEDDEFEDEDGELEGDLLGADEEEGIMGSEEGPEKSFPPDDTEEMQSDMDSVLGDIDPELAGFGDDGEEMGDDIAMDFANLGDELDMGDDMGDEFDMGDDMGDEFDMGDDMGDEFGMGDDMGDEFGMGDDMGDELDMGDDMGDELDMGDDMDMDDELDMGDDMDMEIDAEIEDENDAEEAELMRMMNHYQSKYMNKDHDHKKHMSSCGGKKYMNKDHDHKKHMSSCGGKKYMNADDVKPRDIDKNGKVDGWEFGKAMGLKKALSEKNNKKHMKCCENDSFFASLSKNAKGEVRQKFSAGLAEDALFQPEDPQAGQAGFAPQGRIGAIGGGYTQDDIASIPTLGESRKYITLDQYIAKRKSK